MDQPSAWSFGTNVASDMVLQDIWLPLGMMLVVAILLLGFNERIRVSGDRLPLPPSPPGAWPILGHLPVLARPGTVLHQSLLELARKCGPIMYIRLGSVPTVIVSSADMLREFFQVNDAIMVSRPATSFSELPGYNSQDVASQPYGDFLRDLRKLFTQELLSMKRLNELQAVRRGEVLAGLESVSYRAKHSPNSSVNLRRQVSEVTVNNVTRMLAGKRFFGPNVESGIQSEEFAHLVEEVITLIAVLDIGDFIPFLKRFDLQGNLKRMRTASAGFTRVIDEILLERKRGTGHTGDGVKYFADTLLELQEKEGLSDDVIKGIIFDLIFAGTETSATAVEWLMADLQRNPKALTEVQRELDEVVGRNRIVDESDLPNLPYFQACMKESMRLHPVSPLMLPHESTASSCTIGGYYIPAATRIIVNVTAIHWNPETYDEPKMFRPERFLESGPNSQIQMKGSHFDLVPFGTGRRICLGMNMGLLMVQFGSVVLLQAYDWKLPAGITPESLDMTEAFGSACHLKVPLQLVPSPRLPASVYTAENIEIHMEK